MALRWRGPARSARARERQQVEPAAARRLRRRTGQRLLDERLHVFLEDATAAPAARDAAQIHAQLAREQSHRRRGIGHAIGHDGRGAGDDWRRRHDGSRGRRSRSRGGAGGRRRELRGWRCPGRGRCGRRRNCGRRGGCLGGLSCFDQRHYRAFGKGIAQLDLDLAHHAGKRRRYLHRRLVRFQRHQTLVLLHRVARLHQQFDHRHVVVVADIRHSGFA